MPLKKVAIFCTPLLELLDQDKSEYEVGEAGALADAMLPSQVCNKVSCAACVLYSSTTHSANHSVLFCQVSLVKPSVAKLSIYTSLVCVFVLPPPSSTHTRVCCEMTLTYDAQQQSASAL